MPIVINGKTLGKIANPQPSPLFTCLCWLLNLLSSPQRQKMVGFAQQGEMGLITFCQLPVKFLDIAKL